MPTKRAVILAFAALGLARAASGAAPPRAPAVVAEVTPQTFFELFDTRDGSGQMRALRRIEAAWDPAFVAPLLDLASLRHDERIYGLLRRQTGEKRGDDLQAWLDFLWSREYRAPAYYGQFKAAFYSSIDPRFREHFPPGLTATIRLDEIRWGGVLRDGIPPLKNPATLSVAEASYLRDSHVVFGVTIGGESRAYPKRILGWHELVKDRIGGVEIAGVYCTLCGAMIVYRAEIDGQHYELGTSGFLYRSNKLMYDHGTKSLWSTLTGEPVVGPLVGRGLKLAPLHVVTTTWGEWRRRHPDTRVLSLKTGHDRDYREGVTYREYFATDRLAFTVPQTDPRLKNKAEVLALRFGAPGVRPLAISAASLQRHPVFHGRLGPQDYVVLTDATGANRVFETGGRSFAAEPGDVFVDERGGKWRMEEAALTSESGEKLRRLPAHRAFWFGWFSAFPDTELID